MFDHVTIRAGDRAASERFYTTVLAALGGGVGDLVVEQAASADATTRRLHVAFYADAPWAVDAFWEAGVGAGFASDGDPGPRPEYRDDYYGGFLLDPDGNSAEAVHHGIERTSGQIDHLWIRVADIGAARAFYEGIAPLTGLHVGREGPDRVQFRSERDSFMLIEGPPTEHVQLAFAVADADRAGPFVDPDGNRIELVLAGPPV